MIFSVLVCASAVDTNGAATAGARPAAPAIALVVLRKSRRDQPRLFPPNPIAGSLVDEFIVISWHSPRRTGQRHGLEKGAFLAFRSSAFGGQSAHLFICRIMDMRRRYDK